jgi:hypothetical protein
MAEFKFVRAAALHLDGPLLAWPLLGRPEGPPPGDLPEVRVWNHGGNRAAAETTPAAALRFYASPPSARLSPSKRTASAIASNP